MEFASGLKSSPPGCIVSAGLTIPLCCWPFPQLCGLPARRQVGIPEGKLTSTSTFLAFLQSIFSVSPSRSPQRPAPLLDFLLPSTRVRFEGQLCRRGPTPAFVPPSGFDYPLGGLLPSNPSEPCFVPAAPMGIAHSKLDLPAQCHSVATATAPLAVSLAPYAPARGMGHGDASRDFWVLHRARGAGLRPADFLGVLLSRVLPIADLDPPLGGSPLLCLAQATTHATLERALQSVNRSAPGGRISLA
jgi:hypothetical protein